MYTFQPLPVSDTLNEHTGFYICLVIAFFFLISGIHSFSQKDKDYSKLMFSIAILISAISGFISYNTGTITTFENTKVIGTLIGFQAEGFKEEKRNGKYTTRTDIHNLYVIYEVNGSNVVFLAAPNTAYPPKAILYKN